MNLSFIGKRHYNNITESVTSTFELMWDTVNFDSKLLSFLSVVKFHIINSWGPILSQTDAKAFEALLQPAVDETVMVEKKPIPVQPRPVVRSLTPIQSPVIIDATIK